LEACNVDELHALYGCVGHMEGKIRIDQDHVDDKMLHHPVNADATKEMRTTFVCLFVWFEAKKLTGSPDLPT
jgi:hypothetical protein